MKFAIQVCNSLVSLLLERMNKLFKNWNNEDVDEMNEILPAIKIWIDWMSCHKYFWSPALENIFTTKYGLLTIFLQSPDSMLNYLFTLLFISISTCGDIWTLFSSLMTSLCSPSNQFVKLLPSKLVDCEKVILPEDVMYRGFVPLLGTPSHCPDHVVRPYDKVGILNLN